MDKQALAGRLTKAGVPEHMVEGLTRYIVEGKPTGDFLRVVLEDKLTKTFSRADSVNLLALPAIIGAIYWEAPHGCHGSPEKVAAWIAKGGLTGLDNGRGDAEYDRKRDDELTEVEV